MKTFGNLLFGMYAVLLMTTGVHAATISLAPSSNSVPQNGQAIFSVLADFGSTSTVGGAMDFSWDSNVLTFANFAFDSGLARDPGFDVQTLQNPGLLEIGFGNFSGISLPGPATIIGTLTFDVVGAPGSSTLIGISDSAYADPFYDVSAAPIPVVYSGASLDVISAVPLPAAFWLLLSGLSPIGLALRRRKAS